MAEYLISEDSLTAMADAVRGLTGKSDTMTPAEMVEQVERNIIEFYVTNNKLYALEGMTWEEWANSSFYSDYVTVNSYYVTVTDTGLCVCNGDATEVCNYVIQSGTYYTSEDCCFIAGTQVLVSLGGETKNIEDIQEGDAVVSYNAETGENYLATVPGIVINKHSTRMAHVVFADGTVLEMTDYHPIYTTDGFKSITDSKYAKLVVGDTAKTVDGWSEITSIVQYTLAEPIWTYTLKVVDVGESPDDDTNDNYYANGIVVHNAGCPS